jgi:hypothetical protein
LASRETLRWTVALRVTGGGGGASAAIRCMPDLLVCCGPPQAASAHSAIAARVMFVFMARLLTWPPASR